MRLITIILTLVLFTNIFVLGVDVPNEPSPVLINKIDSEHKNTRLYLTNELTKRENEFMKEFTQRADYYEGSLQEIINKFILKASLIFGGIIILISSITHIIKNKTELKKYDVLKKSLFTDLKTEFNKSNNNILQIPQKDIDLANQLMETEEKPDSKEIKSFSLFKKKSKISTPPKPPIEPKIIKSNLLNKLKSGIE